MVLKSLETTVLNGLTRYIAPHLLEGIYKTNRLTVENQSHFDRLVDHDQNYILAFWHGQMLPLLMFFRYRGLYTFISPHQDGEYIARTLQGLGNHCLRTSLRDRRVKALGQALKLTREGESLALTPDGPVGPAFQVKPGILKLSDKLEVPIIPAVGLPSRPIFFSSWDHFCFPLPLGKIKIRFSAPICPWKSEATLEEKKNRLQWVLNRESRRLAEEILPDPTAYPVPSE